MCLDQATELYFKRDWVILWSITVFVSQCAKYGEIQSHVLKTERVTAGVHKECLYYIHHLKPDWANYLLFLTVCEA